MSKLRKQIALVPLALGLAVTPAAPPIEGYAVTIEIVSSTESEKLTMIFKFAGTNMRLDPDLASMGSGDPAAAQMMAGAFMLAQPGGNVAFVMPSMGMAMRTRVTDMAANDSTAQKCDNVVVADLGAGEAILGISTREHRMRAKLQARGDRPAGEEITDVWTATSMPGSQGIFKKFAKAFGDQIGGAGCPEEFTRFPEGFPLRMKTTKPGPKGQETEDMTVTVVRKMTFTDSDFVIPPGMRVVDGNPFGKR